LRCGAFARRSPHRTPEKERPRVERHAKSERSFAYARGEGDPLHSTTVASHRSTRHAVARAARRQRPGARGTPHTRSAPKRERGVHGPPSEAEPCPARAWRAANGACPPRAALTQPPGAGGSARPAAECSDAHALGVNSCVSVSVCGCGKNFSRLWACLFPTSKFWTRHIKNNLTI
jgi:hypothetical protein